MTSFCSSGACVPAAHETWAHVAFQVKWRTFADSACSAEILAADIYSGMVPACYDYMPGVALAGKTAEVLSLLRSIMQMGRAKVHALTAVATGAALVMVSPGQTSASADEPVALVSSAMPLALPIPGTTVETAPPKASPVVHVPRKARPRKQTTTAAQLNGLLMQAKAALKQPRFEPRNEILGKFSWIRLPYMIPFRIEHHELVHEDLHSNRRTAPRYSDARVHQLCLDSLRTTVNHP